MKRNIVKLWCLIQDDWRRPLYYLEMISLSKLEYI